jgi:predicted RNA binding protein YcfA (HicA-like mRNA interferase family)
MSRGAGDPKSWRELRQHLVSIGARSVRTQGSHEVWRFDDGRSFVIVCNHLGARVPVSLLVKLRRLLARRGLRSPSEPPLSKGERESMVGSRSPEREGVRYEQKQRELR